MFQWWFLPLPQKSYVSVDVLTIIVICGNGNLSYLVLSLARRPCLQDKFIGSPSQGAILSIVPLPATAHAGVEMWDASRHPLPYPTPIPQVGRTELFRSFFVKQLRMLGSLSAIPQSMLWRRHISLHEQILDLPDCLIYEYHWGLRQSLATFQARIICCSCKQDNCIGMIPVMESSLGLLFLAVAVVLFVLECVRLTVLSPLQGIPGPFLARVTGLYRLSLVSSGNAPENYRKLHDRYGKILRTAPNHISIADASAIPIIYGLGSKFLKVS